MTALLAKARRDGRHYPLASKMRVIAGADYVRYVRDILNQSATARREFGEYYVRFFDDLAAMVDEVRRRDAEQGLARLVAGYAW